MFSFESYLLLHFFVTVMMAGVIWVIQLVHYPSFLFIDNSKFKAFEKFHAQKISIIVIPLMLVELATALLLIYKLSELRAMLFINLILLALTWLVTFVFSSRYHKHLLSGYNEEYILKLIKTNWLRTIFWTARSIMLISLIQI